MSERIRIGILEDQQVFRESLVAIFESAGMDVVAKGAEAEGFLAQLEGVGPDVALVDLRLDRMDGGEVGSGLKVVEALRARHPHTRALVLSAHRDPSMLTRCFRAGASGYLCKLNVSCSELLSAVTSVARGERLMPPELGTPAAGDQGRPWIGSPTGSGRCWSWWPAVRTTSRSPPSWASPSAR